MTILITWVFYYFNNIVTLFGKNGLNKNSIVMHFKCVDNGSQSICYSVHCKNVDNAQQKCLRMDEKCFSVRWQPFPTFDPNAGQNFENKGQCFAPL